MLGIIDLCAILFGLFCETGDTKRGALSGCRLALVHELLSRGDSERNRFPQAPQERSHEIELMSPDN